MTTQSGTTDQQAATPADRFDEWWTKKGQFIRAGGGDYEKTFAYAAWIASPEPATTPTPASSLPPLPPIPDHSHAHIGNWTKWEVQAIHTYAQAYVTAAIEALVRSEPQPEALTSERERFEAWAKEEWPNSLPPHSAWIGWQGRASSGVDTPLSGGHTTGDLYRLYEYGIALPDRTPGPAVGAASGASPTVDELFALLPSSYYMDPPDGGDVPLIEQLRRMAADAAKYRVEALRDESGWLIEHSGEVLGKQEGSVSWLKANVPNTTNEGGLLGFTSDASAALRFARKEDAHAVLKFQLGLQSPDWYVKPYSVTEHMWPRTALAQQPAQQDKT